MPAFPPGLEPVAFDDAAAEAAIDACHQVANAVDAAADVRQGAAAVAQRAWRGPARERFDAELSTVQRAAAGLVTDLRATAGAIGRAAEAARIDNARRAAERARWAQNQQAAGA